MGLAVSIGPLAEALEEDDDFAESVRADLVTINAALTAAGLPPHNEPSSLPAIHDRTPVSGFPYSCLHTLRRAYAHALAAPEHSLEPRLDGSDASTDAVLQELASLQHHLLWHSDCEGYYVPIDFPTVIEVEDLPGGAFGSSQRLLAELQMVARPLGIALDAGVLSDQEAERLSSVIESDHPFATEIMVWLALFEAARLSVEHQTAVLFG